MVFLVHREPSVGSLDQLGMSPSVLVLANQPRILLVRRSVPSHDQPNGVILGMEQSSSRLTTCLHRWRQRASLSKLPQVEVLQDPFAPDSVRVELNHPMMYHLLNRQHPHRRLNYEARLLGLPKIPMHPGMQESNALLPWQ